MPDKKVNISVKAHRKLDLICFFKQTTKKEFIEKIIMDYPLPKSMKITKDFRLKVIK